MRNYLIYFNAAVNDFKNDYGEITIDDCEGDIGDCIKKMIPSLANDHNVAKVMAGFTYEDSEDFTFENFAKKLREGEWEQYEEIGELEGYAEYTYDCIPFDSQVRLYVFVEDKYIRFFEFSCE